VVRHGLREFHNYPLVSYGKDATGVWRRSWRVLTELAGYIPKGWRRSPGSGRPKIVQFGLQTGRSQDTSTQFC